jgi:hypothetical protein
MPKINKRDIIKSLVEVPPKGLRPFWAKEMTLLKRLEAKYPLEFIAVLKFPKKFESLAVLLGGPLVKELESRFYQFNYQPKMSTPEKVDFGAEKYGADLTIADKPKTVKDFLDE